jgi:hypothetical protein
MSNEANQSGPALLKRLFFGRLHLVATALLVALGAIVAPSQASAQRCGTPHPHHFHDCWIEPPPPPPWTTDSVIQAASSQIVDCIPTVANWSRRVAMQSVSISLSADRHGQPVAIVAATPQDRRVERCVYEVLSANGFYNAPLGWQLLYTFSNPIVIDPWPPQPPIILPPPMPRPPPPPPRLPSVEQVLAEEQHLVDACRLGPPDSSRWTVRFTITSDGQASDARAEPRDAVGECLEGVVERTNFSGAGTRGGTSVQLAP